MKRRAFVALLGCGVASSAGLALGSWREPRRVPGSSSPMARLGYLSDYSLDPTTSTQGWHGLFDGLREHGWVEGQNLAIEWMIGSEVNAAAPIEPLPRLAAELVRRRVDVILANGTAAVLAAREASSAIPIIMGVGVDPVTLGIVASYAHPEGNVTGTTNVAYELRAKRLELLKEVVPGLSRLAFLFNGSNPGNVDGLQDSQHSAIGMGIDVLPMDVRSPVVNLADALHRCAPAGADGLVLSQDNLFVGPLLAAIVDLAAQAQLPAMYFSYPFVEAGGLMSYSPDFFQLYRRLAYFVDRVLNGSKPSELPVERPSVFELLVNRATLRNLGLMIPSRLQPLVTRWVG